MTWRDLMTTIESMQHRIVRIAGDAAALQYVIAEARAGATADSWAREAGKIARELADLVEVIERVKPDEADDTGVLGIADVGRETCDDE